MYPEEAILASKDAKVKVAVPVHWGGFALALHPWKDSIERFTEEAAVKKQAISSPRIGEVVALGEEPSDKWWSELV